MVRFKEFKNILSPTEAADIIAFAQKKGMKQSKVVNFFWPSRIKGRTSTNTFMDEEEFTPAVRRLANFVAKKTGYPIKNQKWQIVHYKPGQQYNVHHDGCGRMYTMFVYLNTVKGKGGETNFPVAKRKFKPVLGNAVLWKNYNVERWMGADWMVRDPEAVHAGLPPKEGEKWGINVWVIDDKHWKWDIFVNILKIVIVVALVYAAVAISGKNRNFLKNIFSKV